MITINVANFSEWRIQARQLLAQNINPASIFWENTHALQQTLFNDTRYLPDKDDKPSRFFIPAQFLTLATFISYHRDSTKWDKLYQLLWRITHGERQLLAVSNDKLIHNLTLMKKTITRDAHKMKAFVRFCKFRDEEINSDYYLAWYKPDHLIVPLVAPFFQRRFEVMQWTIITPDETVHWDGQKLSFSAGKQLLANPTDELESLWQTYYKAIFNPARIKIKAMKKEMPVRYWHNLPETRVIPSLLAEAPLRVMTMMSHQEGLKSSAKEFFPTVIDSINTLRESAATCKGCPLHKIATQTVFGTGHSRAKLILVGEQPGNQEDLEGLPFVGPAGMVLRETLKKLNIQLEELYLTNAVKHFKFTLKDNYRVHATPGIREINACKPWLLSEIEMIQPQVILCLGLTPAKALISPGFRIKHERGQFQLQNNYLIGATYHPSAILRAMTPELQKTMQDKFTHDIEKAYRLSLQPS